jgi:hypothetical protein
VAIRRSSQRETVVCPRKPAAESPKAVPKASRPRRPPPRPGPPPGLVDRRQNRRGLSLPQGELPQSARAVSAWWLILELRWRDKPLMLVRFPVLSHVGFFYNR